MTVNGFWVEPDLGHLMMGHHGHSVDPVQSVLICALSVVSLKTWRLSLKSPRLELAFRVHCDSATFP